MNYIPNEKRYDSMIYNRCGLSGLKLPAISLGLWHNFSGESVFENARKMIHTAFDMGITHFDLANNYGPPYGSAEENFGKILQHIPEIAARKDAIEYEHQGNNRYEPLDTIEVGLRKCPACKRQTHQQSNQALCIAKITVYHY